MLLLPDMYNIDLYSIPNNQLIQAQLVQRADCDRVTIAEILVSATIVGRARIIERPDHIFLDKIDNFAKDRFKNIGTVLNQWVIETSIHKNLGGHVKLQASLSSHIFHYRMGFRPVPEAEKQPGKLVALDLFRKYQRGEDISQNESFLQYREIQVKSGIPEDQLTIEKCLGCLDIVKEIEREIEISKKDGLKPNTKYLGQVDMYLTDSAIEQWKTKIAEHSLLKPVLI